MELRSECHISCSTPLLFPYPDHSACHIRPLTIPTYMPTTRCWGQRCRLLAKESPVCCHSRQPVLQHTADKVRVHIKMKHHKFWVNTHPAVELPGGCLQCPSYSRCQPQAPATEPAAIRTASLSATRASASTARAPGCRDPAVSPEIGKK